MSRFESITLWEVESSDLEIFYEHQLDPEAIGMAAFVGKDPKDKAAFDAHWNNFAFVTKHNEDDRGRWTSRWSHRVLSAGRKPGSHLLAGKGVLGKRISYGSVQQDAQLVADRPIFARAATDNIGSIRVLQKCGFKIIGTNKDFANGRGEETEEYIFRLDLDRANE